ncbi:MAG: alpha/beta fold hydrolase [Verrucomicrobia bacterium]|nr:alpha/beta fold hydrolase [Verrucomicrobiota bacterium]
MKSDIPQKTAEFLSAARTAVQEAAESSGDDPAGLPVQIYDRAAADLAAEIPELARLIGNPGLDGSIEIQNRRTGETYKLTQASPAADEFPWSYFQKILVASRLPARRGEEAIIVPGLGGSVVGVRRSVPPGLQPPRLEPARGFRIAVTSVVDFEQRDNSAPIEARLHLINPRRRNTVLIDGKRFPLAADFSAPLVSFGRLNELWLGFINMIRGENMRGTPGLLFSEPYDPDRIPVIFVHGLLSSPFIWRRTALALLRDPEIRRRYQFWSFSYATGNPISYSALKLREDLEFAQERYGLRSGVVLVGHSMGGLLSRMQVTNSGRTIWDGVFGRRAQDLYSEIPNNSRVKRALIFQANPRVTRVVFIATPQRGSRLADGGIGGIAIRLIRLPFQLLEEIPEAIVDAMQQKSRRWSVPTSVSGLSPNSPLLLALNRLPIETPHHSIIGDRGRGNTPYSSDGVVGYWSSHIDSAQSEKIVPAGHEAMANPLAVEELHRILLLNLSSGKNRERESSARTHFSFRS